MNKELKDQTDNLLRDTERYCREEAETMGLKRMLLENHLGVNYKGMPMAVRRKIIKVNEALLRAWKNLHEAEEELKKGGDYGRE